MDIEHIIALERLQLQKERVRLAGQQQQITPSVKLHTQTPTTAAVAANAATNCIKDNVDCPAAQLLQSPHYQPTNCRREKSAESRNNKKPTTQQEQCNELCANSANIYPTVFNASTTANTIMSSLATDTSAVDRPISAEATEESHSQIQSEASFLMYTTGAPEAQADNAAVPTLMPVDFRLDLNGLHSDYADDNDGGNNEVAALQKCTKDLANQCELRAGCSSAANTSRQSATDGDSGVRPLSENRIKLHKKEDDMEQWVTDTFYSHFPGYSNEYQKRQNYLRERQRENQQNFLKHQMLHPPLSKHAAIVAAAAAARKTNVPQIKFNTNLNTARSAASSTSNNTTTTTTTTTSTTDKTDLEIIVNNPDYVAPATKQHKARPGTTRQKLLQDLGHFELSNFGIMEHNMRSAELEIARKRDYQRDLMQQIEDKRRSIELLREKERKQEEMLTRRLEAQLKSMQLEDQLEKERIRAEKARADSEHNRMMREQLLAKLEQDAKLLHANNQIATSKRDKQMPHKGITVEPDNKQNTNTNINTTTTSKNKNQEKDNNKVYKYFSNSARHEYRRGQPMPADVEFELELPEMAKIERECFHLCEKICPLCDEPLKSYESCCLRCQRKLALKMKAHHKKQRKRQQPQAAADTSVDAQANVVVNDGQPNGRGVDDGGDNCNDDDNDDDDDDDDDNDAVDDDVDDDDADNCRSTYALVCLKCERLYALCTTCLAKSDVCRACHQKRNVCMNCRRTLCTFCLEEIACGRDTERRHVNDFDDAKLQSKPDAFRVLEVNYASQKDAELDETPTPPLRVHDKSSLNYTQIHNKLVDEDRVGVGMQSQHTPFSMNIARNSVFHPDYKTTPVKTLPAFEQLPNLSARQFSFDLDSSPNDEPYNIERVRQETDKRLSRYLKNYGDLAVHKKHQQQQQQQHKHQQQLQRSKSESRNRSTQTTPESSGRRDVVMDETTQNLSMPLLREMPKMTRNETTATTTNLLAQAVMNNQRKLDNLKSRWEVPAVQKFTISSTSPKVLTQVGAIRKQLQAERFTEQNY